MLTKIHTATAGITWMMMDFFYTGKYSAVSLCSGILAGLVGITPAAGVSGVHHFKPATSYLTSTVRWLPRGPCHWLRHGDRRQLRNRPQGARSLR